MIAIENISKSFDKQQLFENFSLKIKQGEKVILTGPSGCGKTTILRMLVGLETPDKGNVSHDSSAELAWIPQDLGLWANLSVFKNIALVYKGEKAERKEAIMAMLDKLGIAALAKKKVSKISSGEKQRVAMARALINRSKLLVFDEPFSSLDIEKRAQLFNLLLEHIDEHTTLVAVTHDPYDALGLKVDRIAVLEDGKLKDNCSFDQIDSATSRTLRAWQSAYGR